MKNFGRKNAGEFDLTKIDDKDFVIDEILCGCSGLRNDLIYIENVQCAIRDFIDDDNCEFYGDKVDDVNYLLEKCVSPALRNLYKDIIIAMYLLKGMQELGD